MSPLRPRHQTVHIHGPLQVSTGGALPPTLPLRPVTYHHTYITHVTLTQVEPNLQRHPYAPVINLWTFHILRLR
jgi:hypothetical protein